MLVDPNAPAAVQIARQAKIIDALVRRSEREKDVGPSAFRAFQSAIELEQQVEAQQRDLARAATALETARSERQNMRKSLVEALSSMDEGFALFIQGRLELCNDLVLQLFPDVSRHMDEGLGLGRFFALIAGSADYRSSDRNLMSLPEHMERQSDAGVVASVMIELTGDLWFQLSAQNTANRNVVLLFTDVTKIVRRNRTEKETLIDRQEDYLKATIQTLTSGICTMSSAGKVMMHNKRFRTLLSLPYLFLADGRSFSELLQRLEATGIVIDGPTRCFEELWRQLVEDRGLRLRARQGSERVLDIHVHDMPDGGYLMEAKDVTMEERNTARLENRVMERTAELTKANAQLTREYEEKARVEEELRRAKERAEAAVSSKTRFLVAASHDLLQPINAAKLLISTLMNATHGSELHKMVERLDSSFRSTEQLLNSLLDISRLESADPDAVSPTLVNLAGVMNSVIADQSLMAGQKNIQLDLVTSSVFVRSDPVYLLRSIQNLVVNALQYTQSGGRVLVGCRRRGGHVVLEVWDNGIGIRRKDQSRIFEEFARGETENLAEGMGLGLSVVDRACRLLGHKLSLRSKPGVGSVFRIEMAMAEGIASRAEMQGVLPNSDELFENRIFLVIENDENALFALSRWLEQLGGAVLGARSTSEAMQHVSDMGIPPDIILADYQLDRGDTGVEAIMQIRAETGVQVPAILITAHRVLDLPVTETDANISFLHKPVKLERLRPLISWKLGQADPASAMRQTKVCSDSAAQSTKTALKGDDKEPRL